MKFGNDWHGVFIRGDQATHFAYQIRRILESADKDQNYIAFEVLRGLCLLLESCNEHQGGVLRAIEGSQLMLPFEQCKAEAGGGHG